MKPLFSLLLVVLSLSFLASAFAVGYTVNSLTPLNNTNSSDDTPLVTLNASINDLSYLSDQATVGFGFEGLVGFWDFNDYGTTMIDVFAGNNGTFYGESFNDGTMTNMDDSAWVDGVFGSALEFDGDNDYVVVSDDVSLNVSDTLSWCFWVYPNEPNTTTYDDVLQKGNLNRIYQNKDDNGDLNWLVYNTTGSHGIVDYHLNSAWNHVCYTANGTYINMYLDGSLVDIASFMGNIDSNGQDIFVSKDGDFNGSMDDIRFYNRSLSQSEVESIYNSYAVDGVTADHENKFIHNGLVGYWRFDETVGSTAFDTHHVKTRQNLDASGGWSWSDEQEHVNALSFDGTDDTLEIDDGSGSGLDPTDFTNTTISLVAWVNTKGMTGNEQIILSICDDERIGLYSNNKVYAVIKHRDTVTPATYSSLVYYNTPLNTNQWYHVAVTHNGTETILYVNGEQKSTDTITDGFDFWQRTIGSSIGSNRGISKWFNGSIDDVQVYDRVLTTSEISELYNRSVKARDNINANNTITYLTMENNIFTGAGLTDTTYWWWLRLDNHYITNLTAPRLLLIDATDPTINITAPENNTVPTAYPWDENVTFNYTAEDENLDECWYEHEGTNTSLSGNTTIDFDGGWHNITLYCNDTSGNTAATTRRFFVDTYVNVTAFDSESSEIIYDWNCSVGTTNYSVSANHNVLLDDEFNDNQLNLMRWVVSENTTTDGGGSATNNLELNGSLLILTANASLPGAGANAIARLRVQTVHSTRPENFTLLLWREGVGAGAGSNAQRVYLVNGTSLGSQVNVDFPESEWHNITLNYSTATQEYSVYYDNVLNSTINVSSYPTVKLAFDVYTTATNAGASKNAALMVDWVRDKNTDRPSTFYVIVNASDAGLGANTLVFEGESSYGDFVHEPENFTVTVPATGNSTENITLQRAGFTLNVYDEQNMNSRITYNATIYNSTTTFNLTDQPTEYNYWFNHTSGEWVFPTGTVSFLIEKTGWASRTYEVTVNPFYHASLNAYLLESGEGVWATFYVVDNNWNPVTEATLNFYKTVGAVTTQVANTETDSFGVVQIYLDPLVTYEYRASKTGYETETGEVTPIATEYYIVMSSLENEIDYKSRSDFFYHYLEPSVGTFNPCTTEFKYFINDPDNGLDWFRMIIYHSNGTLLFNQNVSGSPSGGTITVNASTFGITSMRVTETINVTTEYSRTTSPTRILDNNIQFHPSIASSVVDGASLTSRAAVRISEELGAGRGMLETVSVFLLALTAGAIGGVAGTGGGLVVIAIGAFMAHVGWVSWATYGIAATLAILVYLSLGRRTA